LAKACCRRPHRPPSPRWRADLDRILAEGSTDPAQPVPSSRARPTLRTSSTKASDAPSDCSGDGAAPSPLRAAISSPLLEDWWPRPCTTSPTRLRQRWTCSPTSRAPPTVPSSSRALLVYACWGDGELVAAFTRTHSSPAAGSDDRLARGTTRLLLWSLTTHGRRRTGQSSSPPAVQASRGRIGGARAERRPCTLECDRPRPHWRRCCFA
jgi:hypothetical protein